MPEEDQAKLFAQVLATTSRSSLRPMLRPPLYQAAAAASLEAMAHGATAGEKLELKHSQPVERAFQADLTIELVADHPGHVIPLHREHVPAAHEDRFFEAALLGLEAASLRPLGRLADGVLSSPWDDGFAASRLLLPLLFEGVPVKGRPVAFAPGVQRLWVAGEDDASALEQALAAAESFVRGGEAVSPYAWRELLRGHGWVLDGGAFKPWVPEPGHALHARIQALDAELARRRETSAKNIPALTSALHYRAERV